MYDMTNDDRAENARQVLEYFISICGTDWQDALCDLLCDLMHLTDRDDELEFEGDLHRARMHYAAEFAEESDGRMV